MVNKIDGWERRADELIKHYLDTPFRWGDSDCACFVSDMMKTVCGYDPIAPYRGQWKDEKTARAALVKYAKGGFHELFFGLTEIKNHKMAMRGDVGIMRMNKRDYCGVVAMNGKSFLVRRDNGLESYPLTESLILWRAD